MMWIQSFMTQLGFSHKEPMAMRFDNQVAIYIASNLVFYDRTKHIEINCHFKRDVTL